MEGKHPPNRDQPEAKPPAVEQFILNEDVKHVSLTQNDELYVATKWEIWAYYACVASKQLICFG